MTEMVRVKATGMNGHLECYDGDGEYVINLEDDTQKKFSEGELEFLNFEPYPNTNHKAIRQLILALNNTKGYECMDIDNEEFVEYICQKTDLCREKYFEIMQISDPEIDKKLKEIMLECLEARGYSATEEQIEELYEIYQDCQSWDINNQMITGTSYDEVEDFVKHSSCVDEVLDTEEN